MDVAEQKISLPLGLLKIDQVRKSITEESNEIIAVKLGHPLPRRVNISDHESLQGWERCWSGKWQSQVNLFALELH